MGDPAPAACSGWLACLEPPQDRTTLWGPPNLTIRLPGGRPIPRLLFRIWVQDVCLAQGLPSRKRLAPSCWLHARVHLISCAALLCTASCCRCCTFPAGGSIAALLRPLQLPCSSSSKPAAGSSARSGFHTFRTGGRSPAGWRAVWPGGWGAGWHTHPLARAGLLTYGQRRQGDSTPLNMQLLMIWCRIG